MRAVIPSSPVSRDFLHETRNLNILLRFAQLSVSILTAQLEFRFDKRLVACALIPFPSVYVIIVQSIEALWEIILISGDPSDV